MLDEKETVDFIDEQVELDEVLEARLRMGRGDAIGGDEWEVCTGGSRC